MKIVIDTNIIFSALLNSKGKIGDLLFNSASIFDFYACHFLKDELAIHHEKLLNLSKLNEADLIQRLNLIYDRITFIHESAIPENFILEAESLTSNIDPNDTLHVALANSMDALLWTGDKRLINGLHEKGYRQAIGTEKIWVLMAFLS